MNVTPAFAVPFLLGLGSVYSFSANAAVPEQVSITNLVEREKVASAAIDPTGANVALMTIKADVEHNNYVVRIVTMPVSAGKLRVIAVYRVAADVAYDQFENIRRMAGDVRWIDRHTLLFTRRNSNGMELAATNLQGRPEILLRGYRSIEIGSSIGAGKIAVWTVQRGVSQPQRIANRAWRFDSSQRFDGPFYNPKDDGIDTVQKWTIDIRSRPAATKIGRATSNWAEEERFEQALEEKLSPAFPLSLSADEYELERLTSPNCAVSAALIGRDVNTSTPSNRFSVSQLALVDKSNTRRIGQAFRPEEQVKPLSWDSNCKSLLVLSVGATGSSMQKVGLDGSVSTVLRDAGQLRKPCRWDGVCQFVSSDGAKGVLVKSTNTSADQLVLFDSTTESLRSLVGLNPSLNDKTLPAPEFIRMDEDGLTFGRLYLPRGRSGYKAPLIVAPYISTPGFDATVGDELPIAPLVNAGFAVLSMECRSFNQLSATGDVETEVSRVARPVAAIEKYIDRLPEAGPIDKKRVGIWGLSYGAEITTYAYWHSKAFMAASVATPSWDPASVPFVGVEFAKTLVPRGIPTDETEKAVAVWRRLSAGLNARNDLPPLLIQSGDKEENYTTPTWFRLQKAGSAVVWFEYPQEGHIKRQPANKWWVYERNVEWFKAMLMGSDSSTEDRLRRFLEKSASEQSAN